jgi:hypothetical protein
VPTKKAKKRKLKFMAFKLKQTNKQKKPNCLSTRKVWKVYLLSRNTVSLGCLRIEPKFSFTDKCDPLWVVESPTFLVKKSDS